MNSVKKVVVILPTYNERENISKIVPQIFEGLSSDRVSVKIVVIDDNSPDGTADTVKAMDGFGIHVFLVNRSGKLGIGSAYAAGYRWALEDSADCIVQMDADFSHRPSVAIDLVTMINDGYDVAVASRYVKGGAIESWPMRRRIMSSSANYLVRFFLRTGVRDNTTGYRAIKTSVIRDLLEYNIKSKGFSYLIETMFIFKQLGLGVAEVPLIFRNREYGETKLEFIEILKFLGTIGRLLLIGLQRGSGKTISSE